MDKKQLAETLNGLIETWENEVTEFKEAKENFSADKIGQYFSALANEANLQGLDRAWLIFGVRDLDRKIVGTKYCESLEQRQRLKQQIAEGTGPSVHFREIYVLKHENGLVVMMQIPPSPHGIPIAWKGHYYARAGESLVALGPAKYGEIRQQTAEADWSAQIVPDATMNHLDDAAVQKAREAFIQKHANRLSESEVMAWSDVELLDRAKITRDKKITRTSLLLLGKPQSSGLLSPHPAQLTWKLEGEERAYEHFGLPFFLNSGELYKKIRNIRIRILPQDQLVAVEVDKYDQRVVLEALHNCIAHQDYTRNGRILVTERPDRLVFENEGTFFEGKPDDYIKEGAVTPRGYRNTFLAQAMAELNMIDTMGYGIYSIHVRQAKRFFPMPDFSLDEPKSVKLTLHGRVVDPAYSRILIQKTDLPLDKILALDRVQKKLPLATDILRQLKRDGLVEGHRPNLHISAGVAAATSDKSAYIKNRAFDNQYYEEMIIKYIHKFQRASREEVDDLLFDKLSDVLDDKQKKSKIGNLLGHMRKHGRIYNAGSRARPEWRLHKCKKKL